MKHAQQWSNLVERHSSRAKVDPYGDVIIKRTTDPAVDVKKGPRARVCPGPIGRPERGGTCELQWNEFNENSIVLDH